MKKILIVTSKGLKQSSLLDIKKQYYKSAKIIFCNDTLNEIEKIKVLSVKKN